MKHNILLDVDTGVDDAMAIMFAVRHPDIRVHAVTCVAGNVSLAQVVDNTLRVLDLVDAGPIPVGAGATQPLIDPPRAAELIHGANGLADIELPRPTRQAEPGHAVEVLRRELLAASDPVTIVALAPLTNIALLLRIYPEVRDRIERILFMGGSASLGNATAVAEFNIWHDPEAAYVVLNSGVPLTMYGLDVYSQVTVGHEDIRDLQRSKHPIENTLGALLGSRLAEASPRGGEIRSSIGDAGVLVALVAPELFKFERRPIQVDLAAGMGRGQTHIDRRTALGEDSSYAPNGQQWPHAEVALEVDSLAVLNAFYQVLRTSTASAAQLGDR